MNLKSNIKRRISSVCRNVGLIKFREYKKVLDSFVEKELNSRINNEYWRNQNVEIYEGVKIMNSEISAHSYVGLDSIVYCAKIGKFCSIGPQVVIGYGDHPHNFLSTSTVLFLNNFNKETKIKGDKEYFDSHKEVLIGNDVWIGANVYIRNGVEIGDGAIIGAGSVVNRDVPPYAIYGGVPAKLIRYRFDDELIGELLKLKWWNWPEGKIKKAQDFFSQPFTQQILNDITIFNNEYEE